MQKVSHYDRPVYALSKHLVGHEKMAAAPPPALSNSMPKQNDVTWHIDTSIWMIIHIMFTLSLTYFALFICPSVVSVPSLVGILPISVAVCLIAYRIRKKCLSILLTTQRFWEPLSLLQILNNTYLAYPAKEICRTAHMMTKLRGSRIVTSDKQNRTLDKHVTF